MEESSSEADATRPTALITIGDRWPSIAAVCDSLECKEYKVSKTGSFGQFSIAAYIGAVL